MKKIILLIALIFVLTSCWNTVEETNTTETSTNNAVNTNISNTENRDEEIIALQPDYKAELYWRVKQIEWNMFTISEIDTSKDPTVDMSTEEKQTYMQSLPEADRMALKEQIQSAIIWDVKVMIPVWIPMVKKELVWEEKVDLEATLEDLKSQDIVSIWYDKNITDRKVASYIKRSVRK